MPIASVSDATEKSKKEKLNTSGGTKGKDGTCMHAIVMTDNIMSDSHLGENIN